MRDHQEISRCSCVPRTAWLSIVARSQTSHASTLHFSKVRELRLRFTMKDQTPDFAIAVQGVKGLCPAGEVYSKHNISEAKIPVLSCEGPCIRGEIARLAANLVAREVPSFARACHAETFFVPHSSMARWVKEARQVLVIDGCFLRCHGRVINALVGEEKVVHIDALPMHKRYTDIFLIDDVPEEQRKAVARPVANQIIAQIHPVDSGGEAP